MSGLMKPIRLSRILPLLIALIAIVHLFRSPYDASNCDVIPDSGEYAIGAQRLATLGRYDIEIERKSYPPRYPPYLSVMMAPLYWIAPNELGVGIFLILAFAIGGVLCAFWIGKRLSNEIGGVCGALLLINQSAFSWEARHIVSDIPALTLSLICCAVCIRAFLERNLSWRWFLLAGLCGGLAGAMRTLNYATLVPLLAVVLFKGKWEGEAPAEPASREPRKRLCRSLAHPALLLPPICFVVTTAIYNRVRFGSIFKDGYQFWAPLPHQFFHLLFQLQYFAANARTVAAWWWLWLSGIVALVLIWRWRKSAAMPITGFVLLAALPITCVHLFYFWYDPRFHLLLVSVMCIVLGAGIGLLIEHSMRRREWVVPLLLLIGFLIPTHPSTPEPLRREIADQLRAETPDDAIIVTGIDPVYLEPFLLRGTHRRIIPLSRDVEYAAQLIAPNKLGPIDPLPADPVKPRIPQMFAAGAKEVVPFTADEDPDRIVHWAEQGLPVYLELRWYPDTPATRETIRILAPVLKQLPRR